MNLRFISHSFFTLISLGRTTEATQSFYSSIAASAAPALETAHKVVVEIGIGLPSESFLWSLARFFMICAVVFSGLFWYFVQRERRKSIDGNQLKKHYDEIYRKCFRKMLQHTRNRTQFACKIFFRDPKQRMFHIRYQRAARPTNLRSPSSKANSTCPVDEDVQHLVLDAM